MWCVYHLARSDSNHHRDKQVLLTHANETGTPFTVCRRHNECETSIFNNSPKKKFLAQNKQRPNKITNTITKRKETKIHIHKVIDVERNYINTFLLLQACGCYCCFCYAQNPKAKINIKPHTARTCMIHFEMVFCIVCCFLSLFLGAKMWEKIPSLQLLVVCVCVFQILFELKGKRKRSFCFEKITDSKKMVFTLSQKQTHLLPWTWMNVWGKAEKIEKITRIRGKILSKNSV